MKTYYLDYVRNKYKKCYGGEYRDCQKARADSFSKTEMDEIVQWGYDDPSLDRNLVDTDFYRDVKSWFDNKTHGYYAWKSFIIYDLMCQISEGDLIVYWDCNPMFAEFNCSFVPAIKQIVDNYDMIAGLQFGMKQIEWTKHDCFNIMGCTNKKYWKGRRQVQASWTIWKKTPRNMDIVKEFFKWSQNENVIRGDLESISDKESSRLITHRHDQSILTNLAVKHNCNVICSKRSGLKLNSNHGKDLGKIMCNFERARVIQL
jgi:hypothetical protein